MTQTDPLKFVVMESSNNSARLVKRLRIPVRGQRLRQRGNPPAFPSLIQRIWMSYEALTSATYIANRHSAPIRLVDPDTTPPFSRRFSRCSRFSRPHKPGPNGAHVTDVGKSPAVVDIPRSMSATFGLKSIPAEKSASEMGRPEKERSFAKGPHEISCLSDVEIVGLASKTGFG